MKNLFIKGLLVTALIGVAGTASAVTFQSPSGNIICSSVDGGVLCHMFEKNNRSIRPAPSDCWGDWGSDFFVSGGSGRAELICVSDWAHDRPSVLAYGKTIKGSGWSCTSKQTGMTCKNNAGRGFTLSRASQKLF